MSTLRYSKEKAIVPSCIGNENVFPAVAVRLKAEARRNDEHVAVSRGTMLSSLSPGGWSGARETDSASRAPDCVRFSAG